MNDIVVYIFNSLAWFSTWCQTRGVAVLDVLLCASPFVLGVLFIRARLIEWLWRHGGGQEATGYSYGNSENYGWYHDRLRK